MSAMAIWDAETKWSQIPGFPEKFIDLQQLITKLKYKLTGNVAQHEDARFIVQDKKIQNKKC